MDLETITTVKGVVGQCVIGAFTCKQKCRERSSVLLVGDPRKACRARVTKEESLSEWDFTVEGMGNFCLGWLPVQ